MKLSRFLPVTGIAILAYLMYSIGPSVILQSLYQANLSYILCSLVFFVPILLIHTYKWDYILRKQGIRIKFSYLLYSFVMGWFYGLITPGKVGLMIRAVYIKDRIKKPLGVCASSVVLDAALDLFSIFILACISAFTIARLPNLHILMLLGFTVMTAIFLGLTQPKLTKFGFKVFYKFGLSGKIREKMDRSFEEFYSSLPGMKSVAYPFLLSIITWIVLYSQAYVVALAFGISVPYVAFITLIPIASLIGLVPITVSGLGTREAVTILLFSYYGAAAESIIAFSLTGYLLSLLVPISFGSLLALRFKKKVAV